MKILAIRGRNLASLAGEFVIPFEEGPLASAGLFAITGPTGAGKSTLLDALCLALFDAVPRLQDNGGAPVGRPGEAEELRLRSNDVRGVLRRGAAEGWAEVDFLGNDRRRYRARWEVRRARNRPEGRLQNQSLGLCDLESGEALGRTKTEVLQMIEERLGLSFEQFRRSALLAQGDFAAFLKAKANERSELLERMTGTEIYGFLSRAAHLRSGEEQRELRALEERLGDLQLLDEETRRDLEGKRREAMREMERLEEEKGRLQGDLDWYRRLEELLRGEAEAASAAAEAESDHQQAQGRRKELERVEEAQPLRGVVDHFDRMAADVAQADSAKLQALGDQAALLEDERRQKEAERKARNAHQEAARLLQSTVPLLHQARALDTRIAEASEALVLLEREEEEAKEHLLRGTEELRGVVQRREESEAERAGAVAWLRDHEGDAVLSRRWELWDAEFRRCARGAQEARDAEEDLKRLDGESRQLQEEMLRAEQRHACAHSELQAQEETVRTLEEKARRFPMEELALEREALERRRERLRILSDIVRETERLHREEVETGAALQRERERAEAARREEEECARELLLRRGSLEEARRALDTASAARKEEVATLRAALRDREPCPVCGALDHPWGGEGAPLFDRLLHEQRLRVELLAGEERELSRRHAAAEAERAASLRAAEEKKEKIRLAREERERLCAQWRSLRPEGEGEGSEPPGSGREGGLSGKIEEIEGKLTLVRGQERLGQESRRRLEEARREGDRRRRLGEEFARRVTILHQGGQEIAARRSARQESLAAARRLCREALAELSDPLGSLETWLPEMEKDPRAFYVQCRRRAETWQGREKMREEAEKTLQELAPQEAVAETRVRQAEENAEQLRRRAASRRLALEALRKERAGFFAGRPADEVEEEFKASEQKALSEREGAQARLEELQRRLAAAQQALLHWEAELSRRRQGEGEARRSLESSLSAKGWELGVLREVLERSDSWRFAERSALESLEAARQATRVRLQERREQTERHTGARRPECAFEEAAERLPLIAAESENTRRLWAGAEAELRGDDRRREQAGRLQDEVDRQRRRWTLWEGLRDLIGSADGNKFRAFAQSLTLDALLSHANRHLEDLARRYFLERIPGSELDLQVIDREMGDEVRPVGSLSGGESFLVSLALALGLASLSSDRTQVESLFIDEGFGSLDPDTLDVALAGLDTLQSLGRKVGIISHVPALVERIGAQVRVESRGGGRSVVRVVGSTEAPLIDPLRSFKDPTVSSAPYG